MTITYIAKGLDIFKEKLPKDFRVVTDLFFENYINLNPTKCRYMCLSSSKQKDTFNFENISLKNNKEDAILGLIIDNSLFITI